MLFPAVPSICSHPQVEKLLRKFHEPWGCEPTPLDSFRRRWRKGSNLNPREGRLAKPLLKSIQEPSVDICQAFYRSETEIRPEQTSPQAVSTATARGQSANG